MGKVIVDVKLSNFKDPSKYIRTQALVDTGATMLVLPEDIVEKIGLEELYETIVSYADGSKKKRKVVGVVTVEILNRKANVDAIMENRGTKVLIGQIPIEEMDLVIDPRTGKLGPRPESPDMPLIEIF